MTSPGGSPRREANRGQEAEAEQESKQRQIPETAR